MAQKKYVSLSKLETFLDNLKTTFASLGHKHTINDITDYKVDNVLSDTSTNPVQNAVLNAEFDAISDAMGALEQVVDTKVGAEHPHSISDVANLESTLSGKQSAITGAATTITSDNLTSNRAVIANGSGKVAVSSVTSTELGYLTGATSNIQTQLNDKAAASALSNYYTKTQIDEMEFITVNDIDTICNQTIQVATASEVTF